jgi:transposase
MLQLKTDNERMARAYSDDLRRKLLEAHQQGEGTLEELAERFRVSYGWARKISAALCQTGQMERLRGSKPGPKSKITATAEQYLKSAIRTQPDLTLSELSLRLEREQGITISISRLWTVVKDLGLRLKKSHCTPPSRLPRVSGRNAISGGKRRGRSIRNAWSS